MKKLIVMFLLCVGIGFAYASQSYGPYPSTLDYVHDGDTVRMNVSIYEGLTKNIAIRVDGVDTPEISSRYPVCQISDGLKARDWVKTWFSKADPDGYGKDFPYLVKDLHRGKYAGRAVAKIKEKQNGVEHDLSTDLLNNTDGIRVRVYGSAKTGQGWCQ